MRAYKIWTRPLPSLVCSKGIGVRHRSDPWLATPPREKDIAPVLCTSLLAGSGRWGRVHAKMNDPLRTIKLNGTALGEREGLEWATSMWSVLITAAARPPNESARRRCPSLSSCFYFDRRVQIEF